MTRLSNYHVIAYVNETSHIIADLFVDDVSELPEKNGIDGYELVQGSKAYVIHSGELYVMDSLGKWYDTNGNQLEKVDSNELT
ncbi:MAG: hypothetical protein K2J39_12380 [Ruminococcus sp.]|nr:hypothetical protein [Ruminococcus sp.]